MFQGSYSISNVDLGDLTLSKFPDLPYNKYKIDVELFKNNAVVGCVEFLVEVLPRENKDFLAVI